MKNCGFGVWPGPAIFFISLTTVDDWGDGRFIDVSGHDVFVVRLCVCGFVRTLPFLI